MPYNDANSKLDLDTDVLYQRNYNNNQAFTDSFGVDIFTEEAAQSYKALEASKRESMDLLQKGLWDGSVFTKSNIEQNLKGEVAGSKIFLTAPKYYRISISNQDSTSLSYFYVFIISLWFVIIFLFIVYVRSRGKKSNADNI